MMKAIVIGASGGIGSALAAAIEARGGEVVRLSRRSKPPLDLDDDASIEKASRRLSDAVEMKRTHPAAILVGLHPGTVDTGLSAPFQRNVAKDRLFTPEQAAKQLLDVIERLTLQDGGNCLDWAGEMIAP